MGIDYQAAIMIGLPRIEIENQELIENEEIEVCAPYYDGAGDDSAIAGFSYKQSKTYQPSELEWDQARIEVLKADFKELTGQDAKVWLSPCGW